MRTLNFDHAFKRELPGDATVENFRRQVTGAAWSEVLPTPVRAPQLLAWSKECAALLELDGDTIQSEAWVRVLGGCEVLPEMSPYAACYGGHQFGSWAGQLGDGRALSLGECINQAGERWELQLKGAGPTPYSRTADGRAVLRSSLREYLCSEAMHHLGIPTTRALSLVGTGEGVLRDMFYDGRAELEPGAVVCRVAPSFLRFGNYELPSARGDLDLLRKLVEFTLRRDYPHLLKAAPETSDRAVVYGEFFREVCERTARLVVDWMRVGFVHGVMNTDNMSILGLTIDYGPYGFLDEYDPAFTPNTTDAAGRRYAYARQPEIAHYNLSRLAIALRPLFSDAKILEAGLDHYVEIYQRESLRMYAAKFGLAEATETDEPLLIGAFRLLEEAELDFTLFFRSLGQFAIRPAGTPGQPGEPASPAAHFFESFYRTDLFPVFEERLNEWLRTYESRLLADSLRPEERLAKMTRANPKFIFRNYLAQEAIDRLREGDPSRLLELHEVLRRPYEEQPEAEEFAKKRPEWARHRAGCSMLSCSS